MFKYFLKKFYLPPTTIFETTVEFLIDIVYLFIKACDFFT